MQTQQERKEGTGEGAQGTNGVGIDNQVTQFSDG
jgi:hypothetical protein